MCDRTEMEGGGFVLLCLGHLRGTISLCGNAFAIEGSYFGLDIFDLRLR
jgi:hypothetical protein